MKSLVSILSITIIALLLLTGCDIDSTPTSPTTTASTVLTTTTTEDTAPTVVQTDKGKQYTISQSLYETTNWVSYTNPSESHTITYTIILPDQYSIENSIIMEENTKVGELIPPAALQENQKMPASLDDISYEMESEKPEYYDSDTFLLNGIPVFFTRSIGHPGDGLTWYNHTFYIMKGDIAFTIAFYPQVKEPDTQTFDMYKSILSSISILNVV